MQNDENYDMANMLYQNQKYEEALKYYKKALNHSKTSDNRIDEADAYLNLGNVYLELKKYHESLKQYKKSYKIYKKHKDPEGEGYSLTGIGINYEKLEDHQTSKRLLRTSHK